MVVSSKDLAELKQKIETSDREIVEIKKALGSTITLLRSTVEGHNNLVRDITSALSQNSRDKAILNRVLRDQFGKGKWYQMINASNAELAEEEVARIKKEDASAVKTKEEPKK